MRLESLHNGFPELLTKIQQFDTQTIRAIITFSATDKAAAQALLSGMAGQPLRMIQAACTAPCLAMVNAILTPATDDDTHTSAGAKPLAWADFYTDLFKIATGWLGWTPDTAWQATPQEIVQAFEGHTDRLKAIHGSADETTNDTSHTKDQRAENIRLGLDPEFDRAGLRKLKALSQQRVGEAV